MLLAALAWPAVGWAAERGSLEERIAALEDRLAALPADTIGVVTRAVRKDLGSVAQDCLEGLSPDKRDVLVLRDYHANNLVWLPQRSGAARVGLAAVEFAVLFLVKLFNGHSTPMLSRSSCKDPGVSRPTISPFLMRSATWGAPRRLCNRSSK